MLVAGILISVDSTPEFCNRELDDLFMKILLLTTSSLLFCSSHYLELFVFWKHSRGNV